MPMQDAALLTNQICYLIRLQTAKTGITQAQTDLLKHSYLFLASINPNGLASIPVSTPCAAAKPTGCHRDGTGLNVTCTLECMWHRLCCRC